GLHSAPTREQWSDGVRESGLGVGACEEARYGDADLAGGDVVVQLLRVREYREQLSGEEIPVLRRLAYAGLPDAHGGKLGCDVQRVDRYEEEQDEQRHRQHGGNLFRVRTRRVFGGVGGWGSGLRERVDSPYTLRG